MLATTTANGTATIYIQSIAAAAAAAVLRSHEANNDVATDSSKWMDDAIGHVKYCGFPFWLLHHWWPRQAAARRQTQMNHQSSPHGLQQNAARQLSRLEHNHGPGSQLLERRISP